MRRASHGVDSRFALAALSAALFAAGCGGIDRSPAAAPAAGKARVSEPIARAVPATPRPLIVGGLTPIPQRSGRVGAVAWSPDGARIAAGAGRSVKIWSAAPGRILASIPREAGGRDCVSFSPDGTRLAMCAGGAVEIRDTSTGALVIKLPVQDADAPESAAWSPDGTRIAVGTVAGRAEIRDASAGARLVKLEDRPDAGRTVSWSPDGKRVVSLGSGGSIEIWNAETGKRISSLEALRGFLRRAVWSPDGARIVSVETSMKDGVSKGTLRIWDAARGALLAEAAVAGELEDVAWSPDGARITSVDSRFQTDFRKGTLRIWDAATGAALAEETADVGLGAVAWSPDGKRIAVGEGSAIGIRDATSGESLAVLGGRGPADDAVAWSPDGRRVVFGASGGARILDASTGAVLLAFGDIGLDGSSLVWSPNGTRIAIVYDEGLTIRDASTGSSLVLLANGAGETLERFAWSPDGTKIAAAISNEDQEASVLRIWDASTGALLTTLAPKAGVGAFSWSPDGKRIAGAMGENGALVVWDLSRRKIIFSIRAPEYGFPFVAWSPDGKWIAAAEDPGGVAIRSASRGRLLFRIRTTLPLGADVFWSPDSKKIACRSDYPTPYPRSDEEFVEIWDVRSRREVAHAGWRDLDERDSRLSFEWSPDGARFMFGGKIADVSEKREEDSESEIDAELGEQPPILEDAVWSPDGRMIAWRSEAGAVIRRLSDREQLTLMGTGEAGDPRILAYTDDGLFDGDPTAPWPVLFRIGDDISDRDNLVTVAQLAGSAFRRPGLLDDFVAGKPIDLPAEVRDGVGLPPRLSVGAAPGAEPAADATGKGAPVDGDSRRPPPSGGLALVPQIGHSDRVLSLSWSPDGSRIASAGTDGAVKIWRASDGRVLADLAMKTRVGCVAFSPDGARLASCGGRAVEIRDALGGALVSSFGVGEATAGTASDVAWSPDGKRIAFGTTGGAAEVWDAVEGARRTVLGDGLLSLTVVSWSPDGTRIATGSLDGAVEIWDAGTGERRAELGRHEGGVLRVAWSPDGKRIASCDEGSVLEIRDASTGALLAVHGGAASGGLSWSPDGTMIATGKGRLMIWDAILGRSLAALPGPIGGESVAWSPDGKRIASGTGSAVRTWDVASGRSRSALEGRKPASEAAAWSPDGARIVTEDPLRIWDVSRGEIRVALDQAALRQGEPEVEILAQSPDLTKLVVSEGNGSTIREVSTGRTLAELARVDDDCDSPTWSPDGERIAATCYDSKKEIVALRIWDASSGALWATSRPKDGVDGFSWSPDGKRIAIWSSEEHDALVVWEAQRRRIVASFEAHESGVEEAAWSPDGERLATAGDGEVKIWSVRGWKPLARLDAAAPGVESVTWGRDGKRISPWGERVLSGFEVRAPIVEGLFWSRDGTRIAVLEVRRIDLRRSERTSFGGDVLLSRFSERSLTLWDASRGTVLTRAVMYEPDFPVFGTYPSDTGFAWSPDGKRFAFGGLVLDASTGELIAVLPGTKRSVGGAAWSPDGTMLAWPYDNGFALYRFSDGTRITAINAGTADAPHILAYTDDGLFDGDAEARKLIMYRRGDDITSGAEFLTADQVAETFHRPGLFADFMAGKQIAEPGEAPASGEEGR